MQLAEVDVVLKGTCRGTALRLLTPNQLFNHSPELRWRYSGTKLSKSSSIPQMGLAHRCAMLKSHLAQQKNEGIFLQTCVLLSER